MHLLLVALFTGSSAYLHIGTLTSLTVISLLVGSPVQSQMQR
jgi:hypothetical protein